MKKILYIALLSIIALYSCTDDLNQMPVIETDSEKVYAEAENYQKVLAKIYASYVIAGQEQGGGNADLSSNMGLDFLRGYFNLQEAGTDEMAPTWLEGDKMSGLTYLSWDANDAWVSDTYYRAYYTITLCNEFLSHTGDSNISGFTAEQQKKIKEYSYEARFLRALSYYFVLDLYGKGPFVDETMGIGAYIPKACTNIQLFDYIESELLAIEPVMNARGSSEYGHATQPAAWSLLSKLYLNAEIYTGKARYTDCITYCKKVIDAGYTLEPEYSKLFNADNDKRTNEIIFSFVVDSKHTISWGATTYLVCGECGNSSSQDPTKYGLDSGWGMFRVRGELPALFGSIEDSKDSRCLFYTDGQTQWFTKSIDDQAQGYFGEKYSNLTDNGDISSSTAAVGCDIDYGLFRLADVYLMYAESVLRGGNGGSRGEALDYLNLLRKRAYGDESGCISDSDMNLQYILDERARELYWEATRRTDLIRYGMFTSSNYIWQWKGGTLSGHEVDSKYNLYPIPASELSANPNLTNEKY